jgi:hypothetical protein
MAGHQVRRVVERRLRVIRVHAGVELRHDLSNALRTRRTASPRVKARLLLNLRLEDIRVHARLLRRDPSVALERAVIHFWATLHGCRRSTRDAECPFRDTECPGSCGQTGLNLLPERGDRSCDTLTDITANLLNLLDLLTEGRECRPEVNLGHLHLWRRGWLHEPRLEVIEQFLLTLFDFQEVRDIEQLFGEIVRH